LNRIDPTAARAMAQDYVDFMRASMGPDGITQSWEVLNKGGAELQHPHYLATVGFPYGLLNRAGLLPPLPAGSK
jgi:hypothetical protein